MMKGYQYQSDFAKKYVAEGRAEGTALAILAFLEARGLAVPDAVRERIVAEKDPQRLARWVKRAAVAATIAEVLEEPS